MEEIKPGTDKKLSVLSIQLRQTGAGKSAGAAG